MLVTVGDPAKPLVVAETSRAYRVLKASHPPTWYLPHADIRPDTLQPSHRRSTTCEWKGTATYWDIIGPAGEFLEAAAWSYQQPTESFVAITGFVSFMPGLIEWRIDGERVRPQPGGFYGGWITDDVVGPHKGGSRYGGW